MITIVDTQTRTKHNLDGLTGLTPILLVKDHVRHVTNHQLESHQLVLNAKVLTDECTINADIQKTIYVIPVLKSPQPEVTEDHVLTLQNLITRIQMDNKVLSYLEHNLETKTIPSTLLSLLLCSDIRKSLTDPETTRKFLKSNTCILRFLELIKTKPGVLSQYKNNMGQMMSGMGYPAPPQGSGPSNGARTGPGVGTGLRQGVPQQGLITPELFQQALTGALQRTGLAQGNQLPTPNAGGGGMPANQQQLLSQLMNAAAPSAAGPPTDPAQQPQQMEGVEEGVSTIQQQMQDRAAQLEQLHSMGLMDDLQNIQALQATNGNVEAAIELLFSDME